MLNACAAEGVWGDISPPSSHVARKVADSQQVVRKGCPSRMTLDQESPGSPLVACGWPQQAAFGSSPGGAVPTVNNRGRLFFGLGLRLRAWEGNWGRDPSLASVAFLHFQARGSTIRSDRVWAIAVGITACKRSYWHDVWELVDPLVLSDGRLQS